MSEILISIDYVDIKNNYVMNEIVEYFENISSVIDFLIINEMAVEDSIISVNLYSKSLNEVKILWLNKNSECNSKNRSETRKRFEKCKILERVEELYNVLYCKDFNKLIESGDYVES